MGPKLMAYSEDQITRFSKSDNNVKIDYNFGNDGTFPFFDIILSTFGNLCH